MKKYILGLSIAAFTISLSGCADFLEEPVRAQQNLDDYFKSEDECKQHVISLSFLMTGGRYRNFI